MFEFEFFVAELVMLIDSLQFFISNGPKLFSLFIIAIAKLFLR